MKDQIQSLPISNRYNEYKVHDRLNFGVGSG